MPFSLLLTAIFHPFFRFWIFILNLPLYIRDPFLALYQTDRFLSYWIRRIPKLLFPFFIANQSPEELTSGDTPYSTLHSLFNQVPHPENFNFFDLGCGDGHLLPFVARQYRIKALGLEINEEEYRRGQNKLDRYGFKQVELVYDNFLNAPIQGPAIIFVAATCLSDETLEKLENKLRVLKDPVWLFSVSVPFTIPGWFFVRHQKMPFCWGMGTVFIYTSVKPEQ